MKPKFIIVSGGVLSSLGKGIAAASMAALLENRGLKVTLMKLDPYINVDPGTMSPFQHGEVFVTRDGAETDLDLGHYERYTHADITRANNATTGQVYDAVIQRERRGEYLGATVQVIPHITDEIKNRIRAVAGTADVVLIEVGGTVGDIESLPFLEAIRQLKADVGRDNIIYVHLTLVPYIKTSGELKTKPTQHSVKELREIGVQPDLLLCRTDRNLDKKLKEKIALFCNVPPDCVITAKDAETIYEVPLGFHSEQLDEKIVELLNIWTRSPDLAVWKGLVDKIKSPKAETTIAIVGKYVHLTDSYKSLNEALIHGGIANSARVHLKFVDSEELEKKPESLVEVFRGVGGILVPGGFGTRGSEGKILAARYARENKLPYFGICLGMQMAVVEFARHVCGIEKANSREFEPQATQPVVDLMEEQRSIDKMGGTMRLGSYPCHLEEGSQVRKIYGQETIQERHRHRYEVNNEYREKLAAGGLRLCGTSPDGKLVEMVELPGHPWMIGCQFHPEFQSKPIKPHPLFADFIRASLNRN